MSSVSEPNEDPSELPEQALRRGIAARADGAKLAETILDSIHTEVHSAMAAGSDEITLDSLAMLGLLNRVVGFHEGAAREIEQDNPFAAFTLLRSLAETLAVLFHIRAHPADLKRLHLGADPASRFNVGRLVQVMAKISPNFKSIYEDLSGMAHPSYVGANSSMRVTEENHFEWQSKPKFHSEGEALIAYLWLVELSEKTRDLWSELYLRVKPPVAKLEPE